MGISSNTQGTAQTTQPIEGDVATAPAQSRFYASEKCLTARMALQQLVDSPQYNTDSSHFDSGALGFVDRHLYYLSTHSTTLVDGYISNLKLMTRIRQK